MGQVHAAIDTVIATGKVVAFAVVSVYGGGAGSEVSVASGIKLIRGGLESWRKHGLRKVTDHCDSSRITTVP
jgi:arginase